MQVNLNYVHSESIGYGRLGVKLHEALTRRGVEVFDHMPPPNHVEFDEIAAVDRHAGTAGTACWVSVPTHARGWWSTQQTAIFTMWETTRLPESFRENLHHFDTILVPSDQNVELFSQWHPNVRRVLLGVDPTEWYWRERPEPGMYFDFLIGGSGSRKGTDLAYKAFLAAFSGEEDPIPRLVMKNPRNEPFSHERVVVIAGGLPANEEQDIYARAHCYVQPSRGEGFGLQPLQAIAQGLPTILTAEHGHGSFAHLGHGVSAGLSQADYFIYGDAGEWWEPDFDELVDQMRWVYANWGQAVAKAKVSAATVAAEFTWDNVAEQFCTALDLSKPYTAGEWFVPDPLKYRLRVRHNIACDIAGSRYYFETGKDYWELADVKRILAEGRHLEPACMLEEDSGLTDEQIVRLGAAAEQPYCTSCGQRYGSGLTMADDLYLVAAEPTPDPDLTRWHAGA